MSKLTTGAVKAALDRCGGSKADAARELRISRPTLYAFLDGEPELKTYASEIVDDIAMAACLPAAIKRGRISAEGRQKLRSLLSEFLPEARAA